MALDKNGNVDMARVNPWAPLDDDTKKYVEHLKLVANELNQLYQSPSNGKEQTSEEARLWALARTHLEIASMFAVKAATT